MVLSRKSPAMMTCPHALLRKAKQWGSIGKHFILSYTVKKQTNKPSFVSLKFQSNDIQIFKTYGYSTYFADYSPNSCSLPGNTNEPDRFAFNLDFLPLRQIKSLLKIFPYLALLHVEITRFTSLFAIQSDKDIVTVALIRCLNQTLIRNL